VSTDTQPPANLFQYSLSPEDEARQVAIWAASRGLGRPGVLYPDSARGERLFRAFESLWMTLGRGPVRAEVYRPAQNDFSEPVERLLNMKEAKAEHARLEEEAGEKLPFRPELPVDFVFIPGSKQELLQLRPLLLFHHGTSLPVMTLSRVWKGSLERDEVFDLKGIMLPEIPWLVEPQTGNDPLSRQALARLFPQAYRKYPRLIAMGMDAYALLPNLARLTAPGQEPLWGRTGQLSLDARRLVQRRLTWISLDRTPRILGTTPPLESIDTSGWEPLPPKEPPSPAPHEASPPEQR
jgi:outer membrane PBP1 activator LpoA protein